MTVSPRLALPESVIWHTDEGVSHMFAEYAQAYASDESILVRPMEAYEGIEAATAQVSALAPGSLLVTDMAEQSHRIQEQSSPTQGSPEPLLAFHTSGSTGSPSCIVYRKSTARAHAQAIAASLNLDASLTYVALPPSRFAYGISIVDSHLEAGVKVTFIDSQWTLPGLSQLADTGQDLAIYALPQHTPLLLSAQIDPQRVRELFIAGGRISAASVRRLAQTFPNLRLNNMYGQAEMGPRLSMWQGNPADFVEGDIGHPLPGVSLRTQTGDEHTPSRILASSQYAMAQYLKAPYTQVHQGPGTAEIVTNDLATVASDGSLRHGGRADHVLNVAGTKVDLQRLSAIVTQAANPLIVRIGSKPSTIAGDDVPVVEIVPGPDTPARTGPIRRALHNEFGRLAGLFDITYVRELTVKESGK